MSFCRSTNLLGPQTILVHMVHLDDTDIATLAETGTHLIHCPSSNIKLAPRTCRVPDLKAAGVNASPGTDGAPCHDTCDMLQDMRSAGTLHKVTTVSPTVVPTETVLEMASLRGAKPFGLQDEIGSLEAGKKADFVVVGMRALHLQPQYNAGSAVVYAVTVMDVELVAVNGGELLGMGR